MRCHDSHCRGYPDNSCIAGSCTETQKKRSLEKGIKEETIEKSLFLVDFSAVLVYNKVIRQEERRTLNGRTNTVKRRNQGPAFHGRAAEGTDRSLKKENEWYIEQLKLRAKEKFGASSEKATPGQMTFPDLFNEAETLREMVTPSLRKNLSFRNTAEKRNAAEAGSAVCR